MDFKFIGAFGIGIAIYLLGLGIFTLVKWIRNKRHFKKEKQDHEKEEKDLYD